MPLTSINGVRDQRLTYKPVRNGYEAMREWNAFRREKLLNMSRDCSLVLDFGRSARADGNLFADGQYVTCDIDPSTEPDIIADICDLHMIPDETYDGVICCAILEHVYNPFAGAKEIYRILKKDGAFFGYVPFLYGYHAKPGHYKDYYRFTEEGLEQLLKDFSAVEICAVRGNVTTLLNLLPGKFKKLQNCFCWADKFFSGRQVSGFNFYARK